MNLRDSLAAMPNAVEAPWTPRADYDGQTGEVATAAYSAELDLDDQTAIDQIIKDAGLDPDKVMCVDHPRVSTWDVPGHGRQWAYKLRLAPRPKSRADVKALLDSIQPGVAARRKTGKHWATLQIGDVHIGKAAEGFGRGSSPIQKAEAWWAGQALSNTPAAAGQVLMCGHFHTFHHANIAAGKTCIYSPSMETLSRWFHEKTGATSDRGAVLYLTSAGTVSRLSIL